MMFNTTFNNISVILWQSVLLVEETRVPQENHTSLILICDYITNQSLCEIRPKFVHYMS